MISVIIPVYNVEPYLRKCIDNVVDQTYTDLEIILIDDGSTDKGGEICDSYSDSRITVYHTENRGLSAARNLGIEKSHGEYLYFLDSDDWIDVDLLEMAIEAIGNADILCFSRYEGSYSGFEAFCALINRRIRFFTWNNLYKTECFSSIRFPEGRIMEDMATTYKLLYQSEIVKSKDIRGYHHIYREGSLAQTHNMQNIFDYYLAVEEESAFFDEVLPIYRDKLSDQQVDGLYANLLRKRATAIARAWGRRNYNHPSESPEWERLSYEAKTMFPYRVRKTFPLRIRGGLFLARFNNPISFWVANKSHTLTRKMLL